MKWYWKILVGLFVMLVIGFFSIDYIATSIVEKEVKKFKNQVRHNYDFDYKSLNLSLIGRTIVLREFEFYTIVDSSYNTNKFDFKLDKLDLKYATYSDIFFNRSVDIIEVVLRQPEISFGLRSLSGKDSKNDDSNKKNDSLKTSFFEKITLEEIRIESGKVNFYNLEKPDKKIVFVNDLDVNVNGFVIDLMKDSFFISEASKKPLFSFKEIYKNDLKNHNLHVDEIQYSYYTKDLKITNFHFENKDSPEVYRKTLSYRSPWFSINVPEIQLKIDPDLIYDSGILLLPKLAITDADITISNDLRLPLKPSHKPMPGSQIKASNINFLMDSLIINNAQLTYIHKGEAVETGFLKFSKFNALALNVTDMDSLIAINPYLDLKVSAKLWDEGNLNTNFRMDLSSDLDRMDVAGSLKNMSMKKIENMVKPLFGIAVNSGQINQLAFNFGMDENMSKGKIIFDYSDLQLDVKAEDKDQKKVEQETQYTDKSMGILNFAFNNAIKSSNIPGDKNYKSEGNIILDRVKDKSVFDLLWNSLAVGMMDIVVFDALYNSQKNYEKKLKKQEKKAKKQENQNTKKGLFNKKEK